MKDLLKCYLILLLVFNFGLLHAQVILQPELPSQGLIQQNQLWNILLINNGEPIKNALIELSFQEEGTGRKIFMARTGPFYIQSGASQMSQKDFGSIQYDYQAMGNGSANSGLLPIGQFMACYNLTTGGDKTAPVTAQDCLPVTVEPFAPPQLAFPADKSQVTSTYPVFNWLAPVPANMFTDLRYKIVLTEMKAGQTAADAIQRNPILFLQNGLKDISLVYPSSYVALKQGKTYAWQVIAQNNYTYSASTEIWSFTIKEDSFSVVLDDAAYPHLQRGAGSNHFVVHEKIKFSYENEAGDSLLHIKIYDIGNQGNTAISDKIIYVRRGMNYIDFNVGQAGHIQPGMEYVMEIKNGWKENWDLRFRYEPLK
jgi:hypothetical protein